MKQPLSNAQRQVRDEKRQVLITQSIAAEDAKALANNEVAAEGITPEARRLIYMLHFNFHDQEEAKAAGHWEEGLRLQIQEQELQAKIQHETWLAALCKDYGHEVGHKLAAHQVEVGMTLNHMVAAFGTPADTNIIPDPEHEDTFFVSYGSLKTGTHFELTNQVITRVVLGEAAFPSYVYNWHGISK